MCVETFSEKSSMTSHGNIPLDVEDFRCHLCSKISTSRKSLKRHIKTHTRVKEFKCQLCGKEFNRKDFLRRHMRVHREVKEFKCHLCDKEFNCNDYLKQHLRVHAEVKQFKCPICAREFIVKDYLQKHMKLHTEVKEFKCHVCCKEFILKANFQRHMAVHSGVKEFKCNLCSIEFKHSSSLRRHVRKHAKQKELSGQELLCQNFPVVNCTEVKEGTDETQKEFKCSLCSIVFKHSSSLRRHKRKHAKQELSEQELLCQNFPVVNCTEIKEGTDETQMESSSEVDPLSVGDEKFSIVKEETSSSVELEATPPVFVEIKLEHPMKTEKDTDSELYHQFDTEYVGSLGEIKEENLDNEGS